MKDAETFLRAYVSSSSIAEIHLYHPQPYHDWRRADRRVFTPRFLADVHRTMVPGGLFVVQTDNPDYWTYMTRVLPVFFDFREHPKPWSDAPEGRTRREILAKQRGLRIFRGEAIRRDDLSPESVSTLAASLPLPVFRSRGPWYDLDRWESQGQGE